MKKILAVLAFMTAVFWLAGCNPIVVSSDFAGTMNNNSIAAKVVLDDHAAGTFTAEEARDYIPKAVCALRTYYNGATTNPFSHYWGDGKPILVTAQWYNLIRRASLQAETAGARAFKCSNENAIVFARAMANEIRKIDLARQGDDE